MRHPLLLCSLLFLVACGAEPDSFGETEETSAHQKVSGPDLVDSRNGRTYPTVVIGHQTWMATNLALDSFDGSWSHCRKGENGRCAPEGRLYTWPLAMADTILSQYNQCNPHPDPRGLCPEGWHVPSLAEWDTLARALGGQETAGLLLQSPTGWTLPPPSSMESSPDPVGFSAFPHGFWTQGGQDYGWYGHTPADSAFLEEGYRAAFWTRTNSVDNSCWSAWGVFLSRQDPGIRYLAVPRVTALSVRCVKDSP